MIWQRALAWAAVLALVATVLDRTPTSSILAPVSRASPGRLRRCCWRADRSSGRGAELRRGSQDGGAHLVLYHRDAAERVRAAVGVTVAVTENGDPVPGSPFTTDTPVRSRSPSAWAPRRGERRPEVAAGWIRAPSQEANGVPYANPVRLDSAVAGAAVLFVNVPTAVATELAQDAPAAEAGEPTDLDDRGAAVRRCPQRRR